MNKNLLEKTSDTFLGIIKQPSIKDFLKSMLEKTPDLLSKNPISYFLIFKEVTNISISDCIFYSKLDKFFRGIEDIDYETRIKFISKHINGKESAFAKKVITNIDLIDDEDKAELIANLQRALFYEKIDTGLFFRLIFAVRDTAYEDLYYLLSNKDKSEFTLDLSVDFLCKSGLMYNYSIGDNTWGALKNSNKYMISELGRFLIDTSLNYGDTPQLLKNNITFFSEKPIGVKAPILDIPTVDTTATFA